MKSTFLFRSSVAVLVIAGTCLGQIEIPSGTRVTCRLEQTISSATADEGQQVSLVVTENVRVGEQVVIEQGASVVGSIVQAVPKRRMGRTGKLDFSIDKVRAVDGSYIPLRYTLQKKEGGGHGVRTGVITAGAAVVFWPAAPFFLLMKGKDITINKGIVVDVFTDQAHTLRMPNPAGGYPALTAAPTSSTMGVRTTAYRTVDGASSFTPAVETAVSITSDINGADVEVDGAYVGSTPSTINMTAGTHKFVVKNGSQVWERTVQVQSGGSITVNARFKNR